MTDLPKGGYDYQWADDKPWYFDEASPPLTNTRFWRPVNLRSQQMMLTSLHFQDVPQGPVDTVFDFDTFLVADFGNNTYDTLGGFSWQVKVQQDLKNPLTKRRTDLTNLQAGTVFTNSDAAVVSRDFPEYTKVDKLPTYTFDGSLSPGQVNSFSKTGLSALEPFAAWTDNLKGINPPGTPDTVLGIFDNSGQRIDYNDDGGPFENNYGSGVTGITGSDKTINLKVTGYPDSSFTGNYNNQTVCNGGSGGGGCQVMGTPHSQSGKYKLNIKLDQQTLDPPEEDLLDTLPIKSVPEPTTVLGVLVLGAWGVVQGLKKRIAKQP